MTFKFKLSKEYTKSDVVITFSTDKSVKDSLFLIDSYSQMAIGFKNAKELTVFVPSSNECDQHLNQENLRKTGALLLKSLEKNSFQTIGFNFENLPNNHYYFLLEGFLLSGYQYLKHTEKAYTLHINEAQIDSTSIQELVHIYESVSISRDLVNTPANVLTTTELSNRISTLLSDSLFKIEILDQKQIESLKMGGLLAVNQGSSQPAKFAIIHYEPITEKQPIVLVGKGVVYDTGGLSLKPTPNSMDIMKCDMGGAATLVGFMHLAAQQKIKKHIIAIIPITDNRIGPDAISPGDVITMSNGKTVEVMNTDAEGRLILADALCYAKKFNPRLVLDFATLTGSALRAIGQYASVYMGTANAAIKSNFEKASLRTYERVVEFPFWDDYKEELSSDVADLKNIGSDAAGAITAGKFLEQFIDYEWLHVDIAGPAYLNKNDFYRTKGGSGVGVRLLYDFIKNEYE